MTYDQMSNMTLKSRHKVTPPENPKRDLSKISKSHISTKDKLILWFGTLFYHTSFSYEYAMDTMMEPMFWFVDHFTHLLGPAFVVVVIILVSSVVVIAHIVGLPFWIPKSQPFTVCLAVIGYWILTNLIFNFYKVASTSPGTPSDVERLLQCNVTICKKCISPKPPRTHHCSICNQCYLNMDHHCPWVNNCVGHFNRRYFLLTMVYIVVGCCFVMLFGVELAFREVIMDENILPDCTNVSTTLNQEHISQDELSSIISEECDEDYAVLYFGIVVERRLFRYFIYFAGLLCIGTSLALGGLTLWHAKLITMGETSIEYHINKAERKKCDQIFVNNHDLGIIRNWEVLLGLDQPNTSFFRNILFPSSHTPTGDGYSWSHITDEAKKRRKS